MWTTNFLITKKETVSKDILADWVRREGLDKILNKKGLTWRKISDEDKKKADGDDEFALDLMIANPSMIKRPIVSDEQNQLIVGFDEAAFIELAKK